MSLAPIAPKKPHVVEAPHGARREDPYFWMRLTDEEKEAGRENPKTQEVFSYLDQENAYTHEVLGHTKDFQKELYHEMVGRIKKDDASVPYFKHGYWYQSRYEKDQEYPIYVRRKTSMEQPEEVLLDVNVLAVEQAYYQVTGLNISRPTQVMAFGEDTQSRRLYTIRFKNLQTGEFLPDRLEQTTGSGAWSSDGQFYFYTTKNETSLLSEKIWRHRMGTDSAQDVLVYEEKDPSYYIGVYRSKSEKYIIIVNSSTLVTQYHLLPADTPEDQFRPFDKRVDEHEYSIFHYKDRFYILTNWEAKNFRLMETSEDVTNKENWKEVIPHRPDVLLEGLEVFENHLVLDERSEGLNQLRIINQTTNQEHYIGFEEPAYSLYTGTNVVFETDKLRFGYTSMTTPSSVYEYDMNSRERTLLKRQEVVGGHEPNDFITERLWATARDGVKIPISLVYKKGFEKNGEQPLLLYAYGSYGLTIDPGFSSSRLSLLNRGFAFAIAHIRGGQMLGRDWYDNGRLMKKWNTFNDFIDSGQFLIDEGYTSRNHLYAQGGSAGGLLMGAVINTAPGLFNGAIAAVPFVDVVSTMLDESIPLTTNEFDEWGNPKEKKAYEYMLSYSPYDQVKKQDYPHLLVTTGLYDSQVQYWEPAKWVARLRTHKTNQNWLLLDCDMDSGHGGSSGRFKSLERTALEYTFLLELEKQR